MTKQPRIPDPEISKQLLANLRQTRLEMAEFNLELAEINTKLEEHIRQQRSNQGRQYIDRK
jgi:DNA-binding protein H-NS